MHAVLATVPLDATADQMRGLANVQARLLSAPSLEAEAAARLAEDVLGHPLVASRTGSASAGRACLREVAGSLVADGVLIDGQADLAFEADDGWVVVDFKTDGELGEARREMYRRQVALYAEAITHATGRPARGVLLRV